MENPSHLIKKNYSLSIFLQRLFAVRMFFPMTYNKAFKAGNDKRIPDYAKPR